METLGKMKTIIVTCKRCVKVEAKRFPILWIPDSDELNFCNDCEMLEYFEFGEKVERELLQKKAWRKSFL